MKKIDVGRNIKEYRKANNLSQSELATKMGITRQTISSWEISRTEPSINDIEKLAYYLNCKKSDLIGETSDILHRVAEEYVLIEQCKTLPEEGRRRLMEYANLLIAYYNNKDGDDDAKKEKERRI